MTVFGCTFYLVHWGSLETVLSLMSLFVFMAIMFTESNKSVIMFSALSTSTAILFFGSPGLFVFFMLFEVVMLPLLFVILFYGSSPEKISSVYYALIYTGGFSMPFVYVMMKLESWSVIYYSSPMMTFLTVGLFLSKTPLFIFHVWLPKAHVEAPTSASMLLAGILLKVGLYGVMKMTMFMNSLSFVISLLSLAGMTIVSLVTSVSSESKVITAYSSITHMNLALYGLNLLSMVSSSGVCLIMLSHGFISSMMFSLVGMLYGYNGSRALFFLGGIMSHGVFYWFLIISVYMANAGIPPFLSFWGELFVISFNKHSVNITTFFYWFILYTLFTMVFIFLYTLEKEAL